MINSKRHELYASPKMKVLEIKARKMLCTSEGNALRNTTEFGNTDDLN